MQVEQWNLSHITLQIEGAKTKLRESAATFYKKGVSKTVLGTSVLIIGAIAFYIFRTRIALMSFLYRKSILGPVIILVPTTALMFSSIVSLCWIINGLYLLYKSRTIEKGENKQVNYINQTINPLKIFIEKLDNKEKFIYANNNEHLRDYLKNLHEICRVTSNALEFKKELIISRHVLLIKEKLVSIKDSCIDLLYVLNSNEIELDQDKVKNKVNSIFDLVDFSNICVESYFQSINELYK